jgi:hypothetical protein
MAALFFVPEVQEIIRCVGGYQGISFQSFSEQNSPSSRSIADGRFGTME